ncbi:MAG: hypothetical protein MUF06_11760 [Pirellulaceae bacterium]|nr:hypothetical protein [Pirellulaceae bacterium]
MRVCRTLTMAALLAAAMGLGTDIVRAQLPGQVARPASSSPGRNPSGVPAPPPEIPPPYVTQQREVEIPFTVKPGTTPETQPVEVRVFVSWDRGQSWHFFEKKRPEEGRFRFRPTQDGEFWFATQTVDKSGQPDSGQPRQPQLRLVIDTTKPQLLAQVAVPRAGEVTLDWSAADVSLNPNSLKIEYQDAASDGPWQTVKIDPQSVNSSAGQLAGRTVFRPEVASRSINLRAEVADAAGNMAYFAQRISLMPPAPLGTAANAAPPPDRTATRWPEQNSFVNPGSDQTLLADSGRQRPTDPATGELTGDASLAGRTATRDSLPAPINELGVVNNPFARQDRLVSARPTTMTPTRPATMTPAAPITAEALPPPPDVASGEPLIDPLPTSDQVERPDVVELPEVERPADPPPMSSPLAGLPAGERPAAERPPFEPAPPEEIRTQDLPAEPLPAPRYESSPLSRPDVAPGPDSEPFPSPAESVAPPVGSRPRLTSSRRFSLEYDIESVGPEGVSEVELWGTSDGGRTWIKWGSDPDKQSPFDVEVNGEANYGFRIVIIGRNGLATSAPRAGDAADIWVGIDLTRPKGRLLSAQYGQGPAAGKLDIRWEASDAHLTERPITLSISDRPDGPFTPIAAGLPNSGQYYWEFDPRSPRLIFLRLEIRDEAGNVAIDQLTEPIKVEGLEPRGRIRGFSPGGN